MNKPGKDVLTGAGFTGEEDRHWRLRDTANRPD